MYIDYIVATAQHLIWSHRISQAQDALLQRGTPLSREQRSRLAKLLIRLIGGGVTRGSLHSERSQRLSLLVQVARHNLIQRGQQGANLLLLGLMVLLSGRIA